MVQLAAGCLAYGRHDLGDRPRGRQPRGKAGLEAGAGGQRGERRAEQRGGVDQRRQLRPHDRLVTGQEAIDGLIQAFGRGARWQTGSPRSVRIGSNAPRAALLTLANTAAKPIVTG
jgi:hypothetical protein